LEKHYITFTDQAYDKDAHVNVIESKIMAQLNITEDLSVPKGQKSKENKSTILDFKKPISNLDNGIFQQNQLPSTLIQPATTLFRRTPTKHPSTTGIKVETRGNSVPPDR